MKVRLLVMWYLVRLMCRVKICNGLVWYCWRLMKNTVDRGWYVNWFMKDLICLMSLVMLQW